MNRHPRRQDSSSTKPFRGGRGELLISIIIPCRDSASTIPAQLEALAAQRCDDPWEVVVADNGSTDDTLEIVEAHRPRLPTVRIVDASAVKGAAHARNEGAREARGEFLIFLDADDKVEAGWLAAMSLALRKNDFVASRFAFDDLNPPWLVKARGAPQTEDVQALWYPPFALHTGACGLGIRRTLHETVGGFDERFPEVEDTDYCVRVGQLGAALRLAPEAVIQIRHPRSDRGLFRQAFRCARYNGLIYRRHGNGSPVPGAWRRYLKDWRQVLRLARRAHVPERRSMLVHRLGWQLGLLAGCLSYRIPPLVFDSGAQTGSA